MVRATNELYTIIPILNHFSAKITSLFCIFSSKVVAVSRILCTFAIGIGEKSGFNDAIAYYFALSQDA